MIKYADIREIHLELATLCNAACPLCFRNRHGAPFNGGYPETYMTLEQVKHIFNPSFLKQLNMIYINGNFGDVMMNPDTPAIVEYFREINSKISITISTNGSARSPEFWQRIAKAYVNVLFCLDGLEDTHHLYRQNTLYSTVIKNAKIFIAAGGNATWQCIKFKHNMHQIDEMKQLSKNLGFNNFAFSQGGRDTGPVFNAKKEFTHVLGDYTGITDFDKILNYSMNIDHTIDNGSWKFNPTEDIKITCETITSGRIYIAANGDVSPCCYTGNFPQTFTNTSMLPLNTQLKELISKHNALEYDMETCIQWFQDFEQRWELDSYNNGRLLVCDQNCGKRKQV